MRREQRQYGSLTIVILTTILQVAAWMWPSISINIRASVSVFAMILILFSQSDKAYGIVARVKALLAFLYVNYLLVAAAVFAGGSIFLLPEENTEIALLMTAFLAASLSSLVLKRTNQFSVRIVKGSGDEVYLVEDGIKQHIPNELTRDFIMLDTYRQIERISDVELRLLPTGASLPNIGDCKLVRGTGHPIYLIWRERRKHIPDVPTLHYFWEQRQPENISDADLENIPRTGSLPSVLGGIGGAGTLIVNGNVNWTMGNPIETNRDAS